MSDDEFLAAVRLGHEPCGHLANLRLAWLLTRDRPPAQASAEMCLAIERRATLQGDRVDGLDRSLTARWTAVVAGAVALTPAIATFDGFVAAHPHLLQRGLERVA